MKLFLLINAISTVFSFCNGYNAAADGECRGTGNKSVRSGYSVICFLGACDSLPRIFLGVCVPFLSV